MVKSRKSRVTHDMIQKNTGKKEENNIFERLEAKDGVCPYYLNQPSIEDDDLSNPWVCVETDPFTSRIRHFNFLKTRMPSHIKTYNESGESPDRSLNLPGRAKDKVYRQLRLTEGSVLENLPPTEKNAWGVEKWNGNKFYEFHGEVGHNTDECNHLRKQIEDMLKARKLSHLIKELKQNNGKDLQKKKGEPHGKEKPQAILMIQPWQKAARQKITQSFSPKLKISFSSLGDDEGAEGPLIIEAEIGGHQVHRMCINGGSSFEILYEHVLSTPSVI
ncbi:hypothetical protein Tco_0662984 [Tanacetum coccineum]